MTKAGAILKMVEEVKLKSELPISVLVKNSGKVAALRGDSQIVGIKLLPSVGVKSLRVDAKAIASKGGKEYSVTIIFFNVHFENKAEKGATIPFEVARGLVKYMEPINPKRSPVRVWCSGPSFQYRYEWYLNKIGALAPARKPRPYTKKPGSTRPSVNPGKVPGLCKHIYALLLELQVQGQVERMKVV